MKIAILTHQYVFSGENTHSTRVVNDFAEEFAAMGHEVFVVNYRNTYPILRLLPRKIHSLIESLLDVRIADLKEKRENVSSNLFACRIISKKFVPSGKRINLENVEKRILNIFRSESFLPEILLVHWESPYAELGLRLSSRFNIKRSIILHAVIPRKLVGLLKWLKGYDYIGFRSLSAKSNFNLALGEVLPNSIKQFVCYSGVAQPLNQRTLNSNVSRIVYAGALIKRKYPDIISNALRNSSLTNCRLFVCGHGSLYNKISKDGISVMMGLLNQNDLFQLFESSDIFVMVSRDEAFGLVYLEAMVRGMIVIASRNEGMDGIILDGWNGFLCGSGNTEELSKVFDVISRLDEKAIVNIKKRSMITGMEYSKQNAAINYLSKIEVI